MPYSCMATTRTVCPTLSVENCRASARPMVSISLRAEARLTPGFRRPMQMNEFDPRLSSPAVHPAGTHSSRAALQNWKVKFAGITPTTTYAWPSMRIARPTTDGSAPYRRVHNPWLRTTTRSRPGCSSSREKVRPSAGRTPSTSKKLAVTRTPATCSGSVPPLRLYPRPAESNSARCAKERLRCDQSRKFGSETMFRLRGSVTGPCQTPTSRSGAGKGNSRRTVEFTTLNIVVFAPIPRASVRTATAVKAGERLHRRRA
jgi:hypothetical protein